MSLSKEHSPEQHRNEKPHIDFVAPMHDIALLRQCVEEESISEYTPGLIASLIKLSSHSGGRADLEPRVKIHAALNMASGRNMNSTAVYLGVHHSQVSRAFRDTLAVVLYSSQNKDSFIVHDSVQQRIDLLRLIDHELSGASEIAHHPSMQKHLAKVPHVRKLVERYLLHGSVKFLMESVGVYGCTPYQLRSVGRYIHSKRIEEAQDGISPLALRYAIGRWLIGGGNYTSQSGDAAVSDGARFLFSYPHTPLQRADALRISSMKVFLTEMLYQEFDDAMAYTIHGDEYAHNFLARNGSIATNKEELDIQATYARFAEMKLCPFRLRAYGEMIRDNIPKNQRIKLIRPGQQYSPYWLGTMDWAGMKFLENTLRFDFPRKVWNLPQFMQDTGHVLKEAWIASHSV